MAENTIKKNTKLSILIVDDLPKNLQILGSYLKDANYLVEFATNGKHAIEWSKRKIFDLILLDIMMPEMSGFDVCTTIRQNPKYKDVPIIFLTAKTDKESTLKGFDLGAQDYITKPFDSRELLARVATHLEIKQNRDILKNINTYLQIQVDNKTRELKLANEKLLGLDKAKSNFLKIISHEIRTPLNGILGGLNLLNEIESAGDIELYLEILNKSAVRLEEFAFRALDISQFNIRGAEMLKFRELYIPDVIDYILNNSQEIIKSKNLIITRSYSDCRKVNADQDYIEKCLKIIIENAIKHSPDSGEITISATEESNKTCFIIKDQGDGFPSDFIISKSVPFEGDLHVDENPSLSLYLCNQIIQAHNAIIQNGNNSEGGSFVKITFDRKLNNQS